MTIETLRRSARPNLSSANSLEFSCILSLSLKMLWFLTEKETGIYLLLPSTILSRYLHHVTASTTYALDHDILSKSGFKVHTSWVQQGLLNRAVYYSWSLSGCTMSSCLSPMFSTFSPPIIKLITHNSIFSMHRAQSVVLHSTRMLQCCWTLC